MWRQPSIVEYISSEQALPDPEHLLFYRLLADEDLIGALGEDEIDEVASILGLNLEVDPKDIEDASLASGLSLVVDRHVGDVCRELRPRITVVGVGGAGGNAVNNMVLSGLEAADFVVANTDAQALKRARTNCRIQLGIEVTQGLGAGARPDVGHAAAEESYEAIAKVLEGANMVFITAGMGGGTGTGAAPVIGRIARDMGILTVGVVTKPFQFEGVRRMRIAEQGIGQLEQFVDTLIIIENQNLFRVANERTTFSDAFKMADDVLSAGIRSVTDLMVMPGLINLDFADVRTVMSGMGRAMMGTGEACGENRALLAAEAALANPLLEGGCMRGAKGALVNITGGPDVTLFEIDDAANRIKDEIENPDAHIIFGSCFDESMEGRMRVSVVVTGIEAEAMAVRASSSMLAVPNALSRQPSTLFAPPIVGEEQVAASNGAGANGGESMAQVPQVGPRPPTGIAPEDHRNLAMGLLARMTGLARRVTPATAPHEEPEVRTHHQPTRLVPTAKQVPHFSDPDVHVYASSQAVADLEVPAFLRRQAN